MPTCTKIVEPAIAPNLKPKVTKPLSANCNGNIVTITNAVITLNPVTETILITDPQKARLRMYLSRTTIIMNSNKTSTAAVVDCARASPAVPYAVGRAKLNTKITFTPIANKETNNGVLVSFCA